MRQLMDETRLNRTTLVKCQFGVADTHPRPFRQLKRASLRYIERPILMRHTLTSHAIQKTSSQTVSCLLSNICVDFRRSKVGGHPSRPPLPPMRTITGSDKARPISGLSDHSS